MTKIDRMMDIINNIEDLFLDCKDRTDDSAAIYSLAACIDELDEIFIQLENEDRRKYFDLIDEAMNGCYEPQTIKNRNGQLVEEYALTPIEIAQGWLDFWNNAIYYKDWCVDEPDFNDDVISIGKYAKYVLEPEEAIPYLMKKMDEVRKNYENILRLPIQNDPVKFELNIRDTVDISMAYFSNTLQEIKDSGLTTRQEEYLGEELELKFNHDQRFLIYCLQEMDNNIEHVLPFIDKMKFKKKGQFCSIDKVNFIREWKTVKEGYPSKDKDGETITKPFKPKDKDLIMKANEIEALRRFIRKCKKSQII